MRPKGRRRDDGAAAQAEFQRLYDRVHPPAPAADVEAAVRRALAAERAEARRARAEATRRAEEERWAGGPCAYCGWAGRSGVRVDGRVEPRWFAGRLGPMCGACRDEWCPFGEGSQRSEEEHRWEAAKVVMGGSHGWLMTHALSKLDFRWFVETPGAVVARRPARRFAYVDGAELLRRLAYQQPPDYRPGPPCPGCGAAERWLHLDPREESELREGVRVSVWLPEGWVCACGYDDRPARKARAAEWRDAHANRVRRPPMPDLPGHPLVVDLVGYSQVAP